MARNSENAALPKFHTDAELLEIAPQTNLPTTTVRSGVDRKHFENETFRERSNDLKGMILLPEFLQADCCAFKVLGVLSYGKHLIR